MSHANAPWAKKKIQVASSSSSSSSSCHCTLYQVRRPRINDTAYYVYIFIISCNKMHVCTDNRMVKQNASFLPSFFLIFFLYNSTSFSFPTWLLHYSTRVEFYLGSSLFWIRKRLPCFVFSVWWWWWVYSQLHCFYSPFFFYVDRKNTQQGRKNIHKRKIFMHAHFNTLKKT